MKQGKKIDREQDNFLMYILNMYVFSEDNIETEIINSFIQIQLCNVQKFSLHKNKCVNVPNI